MNDLYRFVSGPLVWVAFILFIGGSLYRLISMWILARKKDPLVFAYFSPAFAFRSILHWIIPFGSVNSRKNPVLSIVTFIFHASIFIIPVFRVCPMHTQNNRMKPLFFQKFHQSLQRPVFRHLDMNLA
ncbi:MAG: hypothetical protein GY765_06060, partial [bacterium]|nr:hypothetical protein [bacterium]